MQPTIPIKKSDKDIQEYLEYGPKLGTLFKAVYDGISSGYINTSEEINEKLVILTCILSNRYPFAEQKNQYNISYLYESCISINDEVAHSIPDKRQLEPGDIISVDFGITINGLNYDMAFTTEYKSDNSLWVNKPLEAIRNTLSPEKNIKTTTDISQIIQYTAQVNHLDIVTALAGHGIGRNLHEPPTIHNAVGNFAPTTLFDGLVFCVEPIYVLKEDQEEGTKQAEVFIEENGWTVKTANKQPSSHWETMICSHNGKLIDIIGISEWDI